jgi:hypothetical protein
MKRFFLFALFFLPVALLSPLAQAGAKERSSMTTLSSMPATSLPWTAIKNGWGPVEKNKSNGEQAPADGNTITLHKKKYKSGFGCHAPSEIRINIAGRYKMFLCDIGIDDEVKGRGAVVAKTKVVFKIFADNKQVFDSGPVTIASPTKRVQVSVKGKKQLRLVVTTIGHPGNQHVDWANARFLR